MELKPLDLVLVRRMAYNISDSVNEILNDTLTELSNEAPVVFVEAYKEAVKRELEQIIDTL